jgi:hypothetical protein
MDGRIHFEFVLPITFSFAKALKDGKKLRIVTLIKNSLQDSPVTIKLQAKPEDYAKTYLTNS